MAKRTLQQAQKQGFEPQRLGAEVRRLRDEKDLSQDELSKTASVSKMTVSKLERGAVVPSIQILERIAGVLGVDLADLIRTGYVDEANLQSSKLIEIIDLAHRMTEAQRVLAIKLLRIIFYEKIR